MRRTICLALSTLLPGIAVAQGYEDPEESAANLTGVTLAAGVGYATPFGDLFTDPWVDTSVGNSISGTVPLSLNLAIRPIPMVSFGVAFQYAPGFTKGCAAGASCSASDGYIGGELRLYPVPEQRFSPYISVGAGYEWLSLSENSMEVGLNGWALALELGGDIRVSHFATLVPYIGVLVGAYGSMSSGSTSADIPDDNQAMHVWLGFGLRGAFTFSKP